MKEFTCSYTYDDGEHAHWTGTVTPIRKKAATTKAVIKGRGSSYTIIVGDCSCGHFLCIPEINLSCPLAEWGNIFWNRERMSGLMNVTDAVTIVNVVKALMGDRIRTKKHALER